MMVKLELHNRDGPMLTIDLSAPYDGHTVPFQDLHKILKLLARPVNNVVWKGVIRAKFMCEFGAVWGRLIGGCKHTGLNKDSHMAFITRLSSEGNIAGGTISVWKPV